MVLALCATQDWLQVVKCIIHFLLQLCHLCTSTSLTQRQYKQLFLKNMPVSYSSTDGLHADQGAHAQSHEGMLQGHCCLRQAGRGRTFWHSVRSCSVMGQCVRWCSHSAELSTTMGSIASSSFSRKGPCRKPPNDTAAHNYITRQQRSCNAYQALHRTLAGHTSTIQKPDCAG